MKTMKNTVKERRPRVLVFSSNEEYTRVYSIVLLMFGIIERISVDLLLIQCFTL